MKPVDQTKFGPIEGNCFAACLASIFEVPIDILPDIKTIPEDDWWPAFKAWLFERGWEAMEINLDLPGMGDFYTAVIGIGTVQSCNCDCLHAVVVKGMQIVHDPHPSRSAIGARLKTIMVLVPLDPMCRVEVSA